MDLLNRESSLKDLNLEKEDILYFLEFIALIAYKQEIYFILRPNLQDEKDNIFVELAFASNSEFLITSNVNDFLNNKEAE